MSFSWQAIFRKCDHVCQQMIMMRILSPWAHSVGPVECHVVGHAKQTSPRFCATLTFCRTLASFLDLLQDVRVSSALPRLSFVLRPGSLRKWGTFFGRGILAGVATVARGNWTRKVTLRKVNGGVGPRIDICSRLARKSCPFRRYQLSGSGFDGTIGARLL